MQDSDVKRQLQREAMAALKRAAIDALVDRGYAVRGKTTAQIRDILRRRPTLPTLPPQAKAWGEGLGGKRLAYFSAFSLNS